jgi:hypothetical protein
MGLAVPARPQGEGEPDEPALDADVAGQPTHPRERRPQHPEQLNPGDDQADHQQPRSPRPDALLPARRLQLGPQGGPGRDADVPGRYAAGQCLDSVRHTHRLLPIIQPRQEAANGIWLPDKPFHCRVSGGMRLAENGQTLPDCTKCGGLTEAWRIGWMAYDHNVLLVPHGWNTAVGLAADLQLVAALPVARYVEYLTPTPYIDELITEPFRPDAEGYLTVPEKPGLGIELNREALQRYGA